MSGARNDGGPAFPRPASPAHQHGMHAPQEGMTLRDYFAAKAMQALMQPGNIKDYDKRMEDLAPHAYVMADAMMEARTK